MPYDTVFIISHQFLSYIDSDYFQADPIIKNIIRRQIAQARIERKEENQELFLFHWGRRDCGRSQQLLVSFLFTLYIDNITDIIFIEK